MKFNSHPSPQPLWPPRGLKWRGGGAYCHLQAGPTALHPQLGTAPRKVIAVEAAARPEGAATAALRERSKLAAFERRASSRSLVLARRREGSQPGTPENLRCAEDEASNFDVSLDLEDRESVFSPAPGDKEAEMEAEPVKWGSVEVPLLVPKKMERSEKEKREIEADLEKLAERLAATLSAACSKKKKRR